MKLELIEDWRGAVRLLSVRVGALWAAIVAYLVADPSALLNAWAALPPDIQALFPWWVRAIAAFGGMAGTIWLARVTKQPVVDAAKAGE